MELILLTQNSVQQNYLPELHPRYYSSYQKCPSFNVGSLHPPGVDCPPFPWTFIRNPGDGEESYTTAKNLLISSTKKPFLIDLHLPLSKVSFLPHQIAIFM